MNETEVFDEEFFEAIVASTTSIRGEIYESATSDIKKLKTRKERLYLTPFFESKIKVGDLILLHNNKRKDRKGEKFSFAWLGFDIVSEITAKGVTTLNERNVEILKVK